MLGSGKSNHWSAIAAFPITLMVLGTLWASLDVFILGNWDEKFGAFDTFLLGILAIGYMSGTALLGNFLLVWLFRSWVRKWSFRKLVFSSAAASIATILLTRFGEAVGRVADPITRVLKVNESIIYLGVIAAIPSAVMTATVIIVRYACSERRTLDA